MGVAVIRMGGATRGVTERDVVWMGVAAGGVTEKGLGGVWLQWRGCDGRGWEGCLLTMGKRENVPSDLEG